VKRIGPSLEPQQVNNLIWYYENKSSIHIFLAANLIKRCAAEGTGCNFKIFKAKLMKSLKRMNYKTPARKVSAKNRLQ